MTTQYTRRCGHCNSHYTFIGSHHGEFRQEELKLNDERYCPNCYAAVLDVLSRIPVKIDKRFVTIDMDKETFMKLKEKHDERIAEQQKNNPYFLNFVRVLVGRSRKGKDGNYEWEKSIQIEHEGALYFMSFRPDEPDNYKIMMEAEVDAKALAV